MVSVASRSITILKQGEQRPAIAGHTRAAGTKVAFIWLEVPCTKWLKCRNVFPSREANHDNGANESDIVFSSPVI